MISRVCSGEFSLLRKIFANSGVLCEVWYAIVTPKGDNSNYRFLSLVLQVNFLCLRGRQLQLFRSCSLWIHCWWDKSMGLRVSIARLKNVGTSFHLADY